MKPDAAVPVMDGPLRPNRLLDDGVQRLALPGVDCLVATAGGLLCSQGADLVTLAHDFSETGRDRMPAPITCLAVSPDGTLAIGLDGLGILLRGGPHAGTMLTTALGCPTAATFVDRDTLVVTNGSAALPASQWKRDLMGKGASGSVWRFHLAQGDAKRLADGLAFPSGVVSDGGAGLFVSEAWRHRIVRLDLERPSSPNIVLDELPAYPGRIAVAAAGGFWLALFAPRNALVEFVLNEKLYRARMMEQLDPDHWIAPALVSGRSFLEPIQGGARKKLNQLQPWSPSWSYGLVARTNGAFALIDSFHSRADGQVHGVTSVCESNGRLLIGAKGAGRIVEIVA